MDSLIVDSYAILYFYHCIRTECKMFILEYIAELVADALSVANTDIDIVVGMTIYPVVYSTFLNVISQFHGKRTIGFAVFKFRAQHPE